MSVAYLGIDPGPVWTGLVVRLGPLALAPRVLHNDRPASGHGVTDAYLAEVVTAVRTVQIGIAEHYPAARLVTAIEGVNVPGGFKDGKQQFAQPKDILGLGIIYGHLRAVFPEALVAQPNKHGHGLLAGYPENLVTQGERRAGLNRAAPQKTEMRHCRSAYDVTLTAERIAGRRPVAAR